MQVYKLLRLVVIFSIVSIQMDAQQFILKGTASQSNPVTYELTSNTGAVAGMITNQYPLTLTSNFTLTFEINLGSEDWNGADGIAFMLTRNCNPSLTPGSGLGVENTANSIIIDFDTYDNSSFYNDISDDHIGIYSDGIFSSSNNIMDGTTTPVCIFPDCSNAENGLWDTVSIEWVYTSATVQTIKVYVNGVLIAASTGNHIQNRFLNQTNVFYSIAASTGALTNQQQVRFPTNNNPTFCSGQSFTLTAPSLGSNYVWSGSTSTTNTASYIATTSQTITCNYTDFCNQAQQINFNVDIFKSITNPSSTQNVCLNGTPSAFSVSTNETNTDGINFVYFTSPQTPSNRYTGGTLLASVTPSTGQATYAPPALGSAGSLPNVSDTFYVYAISNPAPTDALCRPSQEIMIIVNKPISDTIHQTICEGLSFKGRSATGIYADTFKNAASNGCDSIQVIDLKVNLLARNPITKVICEGQNFMGKDTTGYYSDTFKNAAANGCDSIRTINLTVNPKTTSNITKQICLGESLYGYNTSGFYIDTLYGKNANGCDSIRKLTLTILPKDSSSYDSTICEGGSVNGHTIAGIYVDRFTNVLGCDSIRRLVLSVTKKIFTRIDTAVCEGMSVRGQSKTGVYYETFTSAKNCDSIIILNLTINPKSYTQIEKTICEGQSYAGRTTTGVYSDTFVNKNKCDSIVFISLTVIGKVHVVVDTPAHICQGKSKYLNAKGGTSYLWKPSTYLNDPTLQFPQASPSANITYTVYVANACFKDSAIYPVYVHATPSMTICKDTTIFRGTNAKLFTVGNGLNYEWSPKELIEKPFANAISVSPTKNQQFGVTMTDSFGCQNSASVWVYVDDHTELLLPTGFSPNGDGLNDYFRIVRYYNIKTLEQFEIYNRWGQLVFSTTDLEGSWDGKFNNEWIQDGIYTWKIKAITYDHKTINQSGNVTVIK